MDIMKYGGDCTVISPQALVKRVTAEFERARNHYPK
jgi:predicted DNA-binding transcriptional regulator YafY